MSKRKRNRPLVGGTREPAKSGRPEIGAKPAPRETPVVVPAHGTPVAEEELAAMTRAAAKRKVGRTDFQQSDSGDST